MKLIVIARWLIFGSMLLGAGCGLAFLVRRTVDAATFAAMFNGVAWLSGIVQSLLLTVLALLKEFPKREDLGFWARDRLNHRVSLLRNRLFFRMSCGIVTSVFLVAASVLVGGPGSNQPPPFWPLATSISLCGFLLVLLVTTFVDCRRISKLKADLDRMAVEEKKKKETLEALRGDV